MNDRHHVIDISVQLENNVSQFICLILKIDVATSKSFGNKSSSLSFNSKINLLIDIGVLEKNQAEKFTLFMQIRNQFAHNLNADSFENCLKETKDLENRLKKLYPDNSKFSSSIRSNMYFNSLLKDIALTTEELITSFKIKNNLM